MIKNIHKYCFYKLFTNMADCWLTRNIHIKFPRIPTTIYNIISRYLLFYHFCFLNRTKKISLEVHITYIKTELSILVIVKKKFNNKYGPLNIRTFSLKLGLSSFVKCLFFRNLYIVLPIVFGTPVLYYVVETQFSYLIKCRNIYA